jgi:hypothetical protein
LEEKIVHFSCPNPHQEVQGIATFRREVMKQQVNQLSGSPHPTGSIGTAKAN